jgi:hypothetical protein
MIGVILKEWFNCQGFFELGHGMIAGGIMVLVGAGEYSP